VFVRHQKRDELKADQLQKREFIDSERKKTVERLRQYKLVIIVSRDTFY